MKILKSYLKDHLSIFLLAMFCISIFTYIFSLYSLEIEAIFYSCMLCFVLVSFYGIYSYIQYHKRYRILEDIQNEIHYSISHLPPPKLVSDEQYQELIVLLNHAKNEIEIEAKRNYLDLLDYYTLWLHQIKTPIAAMHLILQENPSDDNNRMQIELIKIEQYVSMVLTYLRIGSDSTDYVFKENNLCAIVKQAIHTFAPFFIQKKITLEFNDFEYFVLTDEKWLLFVIEQILSNALKYTKKGTIKIHFQDDCLYVEDSGKGIASEDIERVFEKGYTGFNGRSDMSATGLGLYLSRKVMSNLNHDISLTSTLHKGTTVIFNFKRKEDN